MKLLGLFLIVLGLGGYAVLTMTSSQTVAGILPYTDEAVVTEGSAIYASQCASCHGADLSGQANWTEPDQYGYMPAPPHDETGHTWHHPDDLLVRITTLGTEAVVGNGYKSYMPGFGDMLSEDEVLAVLAYIKSTWPDAVIEQHNQINAAAANG